MAELPFFPMAIDAYLADTRHLDDAEHGRYHLILYELWRSPKQRLPNDDEWLARRLCRSVERIIAEIRPLLKEFCDCDGNWITQKRLSREFLRARKVTKQRSDAAKALWRKKKQVSGRICEDIQPRINSADEPTLTLTPTPTHTPTSSSVAKATGEQASPKDQIFREYLPWMNQRAGKDCRSVLGQLCSSVGDDDALAALRICREAEPVDPVAWIKGRMRPRESNDQRKDREIREAIERSKLQ